MLIRTRAIATVAALSAALLSTSPLSTAEGSATHLRHAGASTPAASVPTVVAHMGATAIHLSVGHNIHAGRVIFRVVTKQGGHTIQIVWLHTGYTFKEASQDFGKAFSGDVAAIGRLDHKVTFMGGAPTRPGHPGAFSLNLRKAHLLVFDQNSDALTRLRVFGKPPARPGVPAGAGITTFSYGFGVSKQPLPSSGWARIRNVSDQPHFVVLLHVKDSTTPRMVRKFIKSAGHGNPSWALRGSTSTGVISPSRREVFQYDLHTGKYLLACFWPDDDTGMPHFFMGMWRLVRLG